MMMTFLMYSLAVSFPGTTQLYPLNQPCVLYNEPKLVSCSARGTLNSYIYQVYQKGTFWICHQIIFMGYQTDTFQFL